jgi:TM2 domain-containing membrane protein YozV
MNDQTTQTQTHLEWREKERPPGENAASSKRIAAGVCGILLGAFGVHKFILGYTAQGLILLLVTLLTLGFGGFLTGLIGIIEGIVYLTKSDAEFVRTYQTSRRNWF